MDASDLFANFVRAMQLSQGQMTFIMTVFSLILGRFPDARAENSLLPRVRRKTCFAFPERFKP